MHGAGGGAWRKLCDSVHGTGMPTVSTVTPLVGLSPQHWPRGAARDDVIACEKEGILGNGQLVVCVPLPRVSRSLKDAPLCPARFPMRDRTRARSPPCLERRPHGVALDQATTGLAVI